MNIKNINGKEYILKDGKWKLNIDDIYIIELYNKYYSINKVAKILNVDNSTIKNRLIKNNINIRNHKEVLQIVMKQDVVKEKLRIANKKSEEKRKNTNLEKYGTEWSSQTKQFQEKVKNTSQEKYGEDHFLKNKKVQEKKKETCIKKYNEDNVSKVLSIKKKREKTNLKKFGKKTYFETDEFKNNIKNIFIEKYGYDNPLAIDIFKEKWRKTFLSKRLKEVLNLLKEIDLELLDKYTNYSEKVKIKCKKCETIFEATIFNISQGCNRCPKCYPIKTCSIQEKELSKYIEQILSNKYKIELRNRNIIYPYELDIFIPELKIAFEYDGLYYHSDKFQTKQYHLNKTEQCIKNKIKLIHIFEDEWNNKQNIVKGRIRQILKMNNKKVIYARKCKILEIDPSIKNDFLDKYHLQGKDNSTIKLGAFYNNELVSVMTFSKGNVSKGSKYEEGVWELNRFCSNYNYHIPGIASKILEHFKRNYEWKKIFSYADRRWSTGNLYYKLGFDLEHITNPNYWYVGNNCKRIHRFNLRKTKSDPKDIPEWILRQKQGYRRIWDCGNYKFSIINGEMAE